MAWLFRDQRNWRFSLRTKFLLLVLAILTLPWMGIRYVNDMKRFLLQGQEDALLLMARAVATVLNDREELFRPDTGVPELIGGRNDLYAHQLPNYLQLDGDSADWGDQLDNLRDFTGALGEECTADYQPLTLSVRHLLGYRGQFLYALFEVDDDKVLYRENDFRRLDHSDQIRMSIQNLPDDINRYLLLTRTSGRMSVYLMDEDWRYPLTGESITDINAVMKETESGYTVEIRLPRFMLRSSSRVGFEIVDVDDPETRTIRDVITTYPRSDNPQLSRVMIHSPELAKILGGLNRQVARIWIIDGKRRVRAVVGSLGGIVSNAPDGNDFTRWFYDITDSFFSWILQLPEEEFTDVESNVTHRSDVIIDSALNGDTQSTRRMSVDNRSEILAAATPIRSSDGVIGTVLVEQSSTEVLKLQRQAMKSIAVVALVAFVIITLTLFAFATQLTIRIRKLHYATEHSITPEGRVRSEYNEAFPRGGRDEIGDLSKSITSMLGRLSQYTKYLEAMPDTLAHELNNPLNVVSSSLEILCRDSSEAADSPYMVRARKGLVRLRSILTSLTEAANLEEALQYEDLENFDLCEVVEGCVEGYRISFPDHRFILNRKAMRLPVAGAPDRFAQLLDKLIDNSVDFGEPNGSIELSLAETGNFAVMTVSNQGSSLPVDMKERLFDPMVSVGRKDATQAHLGLGLFIARLIAEHHHGDITASNIEEPAGVCFTVRLPLRANAGISA
ncbi:MAG: proteobacterial dedicated sortase system histidine kinase [marine bacterium B5-7]|nr:MAG: proteobacterial dedicated sortase system histidine kinase [marine bacterium B5-7]